MGNPDADLEIERGGGETRRAVDRGGDPIRDAEGRLSADDPGAHHEELVAADTTQRVAGPNRCHEAVRHDAQQLVTGGMTELVVHPLETVDIDVDDGGPSGLPGEGRLERVHRRTAVHDPGQQVMGRATFQLRPEVRALGHVFDGHDRPRHASALIDEAAQSNHAAPRAAPVTRLDPDLQVVVGALVERRVERGEEDLPVLVGDRRDLGIHGVHCVEAQDAAEPVVRIHHAPIRQDLEHAGRQRLRQPVQELLARPQRFLGGHLFGDVDHLGEHVSAVRTTEPVVVRDVEPDPRGIGALVTQPDGGLNDAGLREHLHPALDRPLLVVGVDEVERTEPNHVLGSPAQDLRGGLVDIEEDRDFVLACPGHPRRARLESDVGEVREGRRVTADDDPDVDAVAGASVQVVDHRGSVRADLEANLRAGGARFACALPRGDDEGAVLGDNEIERGSGPERTVVRQGN